MPKAPPKTINSEYFLKPLLLVIIYKITNIIIRIKSVKKLYKLSSLNEKGYSKEFYTELSHITREFVEYTTYIRTLEMTTQDIIQNKQLFLFDSNAFNSWINLLLKADMVKYAKQSVESSEMIVDKDKVRQFIDDLSD